MNNEKRVRDRTGTRRRLLDAAETLARRLGPANVSLDAVAAEAGVSKGGLFYHFPSKVRLLEALVADHLDRLSLALQAEEQTGRPDSVIITYLQQFLDDRQHNTPPPSGLLSVFAENPRLLEPIRLYEQGFLERIRENARDPEAATLVFLAVQGIRAAELLGTLPIEASEAQALIQRYLHRLSAADDTSEAKLRSSESSSNGKHELPS